MWKSFKTRKTVARKSVQKLKIALGASKNGEDWSGGACSSLPAVELAKSPGSNGDGDGDGVGVGEAHKTGSTKSGAGGVRGDGEGIMALMFMLAIQSKGNGTRPVSGLRIQKKRA